MQCPEFLGVKMAKEPAYVDLKKIIVRDSQGRRITEERAIQY